MKKNKVIITTIAMLASTSIYAQEVAAIQNDADVAIKLEPIKVQAPKIDIEYAVTDATTATKTDTPLNEIPFSIQVVPKQVIQDQQAYRLEDVIKNVSGMQSQPVPYSFSYETLQSRGFKSEPFRDGTRVMFLTVPLANAERVEVLKGSAAIQYGRVEPGGMVNVVTKNH